MSIIKPQLLEDLKQVIAEITFSRTDRVTKITDGSVLNGLFYGMAKIGQKTLKDVALIQSILFPQDANGSTLDEAAAILGIAPRLGALGSHTYVRLWGVPGTAYNAGVQTVTGNDGITFNLLENKTIGSVGFTYAMVQSQTTGANTKVNPYTLNTLSSAPTGHKYVTNEYLAEGGRDIEDDLSFQLRIKDSFNSVATGTMSKLEQIFMLKNPKVLRLFNHGTNGNGKLQLSIIAQNGDLFSTDELASLISDYSKFLSLSEINLDWRTDVGVELVNAYYSPFDMSFRCSLKPGAVVEDVAKYIQIRVDKYIDYRTWILGDRIQWDDILQIVKNTPNVLSVPDNYFYPHNDVLYDFGVLPRLRGFEMLDLSGNIMVDTGNVLSPTYYPSSQNFNLIANVLRTI